MVSIFSPLAWARERYQLTEHRACRAQVVHRAVLRYRYQRRDDTSLRRRLLELADDRLTYGQLRLHILLRREGWPINKKRVHGLYAEEGLQLVSTAPGGCRGALATADRHHPEHALGHGLHAGRLG